ncbi:MAG: DNA-binding protein WhiA [Clostridiales bacterium]|nr:DNA-binding protein WhiA [Eubacteriales bacterium]MDH7567291.1 DNA-binding protein WhiA [Clostridiales bacterium]
MSFSSAVKNEICRLETGCKACLLAELAAVIAISGTIRLINDRDLSIRIVTENAAFARRVFSIIKKVYNIYPEVIIRKCNKLKKHVLYTLVIPSSMGAKRVLEDVKITFEKKDGNEKAVYNLDLKGFLKKPCCKKSYLRGAFLAGGSISDPEKTYHLEITCHSMDLAVKVRDFINRYHLNAKVIKRKANFVAYIKEGENIVDFLNIIGAHSSLLELENVRILKEMRNNVNRIVNCETANLEKTVNASLRQIENIRYIKEKIGFDSLPKNLKEIAEVRLNNEDANLKEMGEMLVPPLGKSGVNHRLRKLDKIAENLRSRKGDNK